MESPLLCPLLSFNGFLLLLLLFIFSYLIPNLKSLILKRVTLSNVLPLHISPLITLEALCPSSLPLISSMPLLGSCFIWPYVQCILMLSISRSFLNIPNPYSLIVATSILSRLTTEPNGSKQRQLQRNTVKLPKFWV